MRCRDEDGATVLTVPAYRANFFFNTRGNISQRPQVDLLFLDFARGDLVHLQGAATIDWAKSDPATWPGAKRLIHFRANEVLWRQSVLGMRWGIPDVAPEFVDQVPRSILYPRS